MRHQNRVWNQIWRQMRHSNRWMVVILVIACLQFAACAQAGSASEELPKPAKVEQIAGKDVSRVILTAQAAQRLGIETTQVQNTQVNGAAQMVVPYSAVIYDLHGSTWVYTNPNPLTYMREAIKVDRINGNLAVLSSGPPVGTVVVTVGAPELYGTEFGVGED
jgi:hypothetical protein